MVDKVPQAEQQIEVTLVQNVRFFTFSPHPLPRWCIYRPIHVLTEGTSIGNSITESLSFGYYN